MNEQPYKEEHLQEYTGILTSHDAHSENFKMELKAEDNPVMERWAQKDKPTIELEFRYNGGPSTMFFHNRQTCERIECPECARMQKRYDIFAANLYHLQCGDTFRIKAALINNDRSVLPAEIHNFENYQPLWVACTEYPLRLSDTPEGIKKKVELEQQRLQRERDKKTQQEEAEKKAKRKKRKESIKQFFGGRPYIAPIIVSVIGGIILTIIVQQTPRIFKYLMNIFQN